MKLLLISIVALAVLAAPAPLAPDGVSVHAAEPEGEEDALDEFVPSEEVPADAAISFPVDI